MFDALEGIDRSIVLAINGTHSAFLDECFWIISGKFTWIPLYLLLLYLVWKQFGWKKTGLFLLIVGLCIAVVDTSSVYFFKEAFQRYRPSHHAFLKPRLHFYQLENGDYYLGGQYGFISSHASNFFAFSTLAGLTLRKYYPKLIWILFALAALVCYSRIYLGVHYLSDVFVGGLWGFIWAWLFYHFLVKRFLFEQIKIK
ncbi:MAG: phosphatase PAP2 family protein [Fluviicola sp.]|nr:phosphatase PAP2 family protein [Fluviicola sp.]